MAQVRQILVLMRMDTAYPRLVLQGVNDYVQQHGLSWRFEAAFYRDIFDPVRVRQWRGDGMFGFIDMHLYQAVLDTGIPAVTVSHSDAEVIMPKVVPDDEAIGRLAAQHLLERGLRDFASAGFTEWHFSRLRTRVFADAVTAAGGRMHDYTPRYDLLLSPRTAAIDRDDGLLRLPKPLGMFVTSDLRARDVAELCRMSGVKVPEEVALLGVDNDELICDLTEPPISSIDTDIARIGWQTAAMLHRLMDGVAGPTVELVPPRGLVVRRSTEMAAGEPEVAAALQYIRANALRRLTVPDVASAVSLGRRALEVRFRRVLGRGVREQIELVRMEQAMALLSSTQVPVKQIARQLGYRDTAAFSRAFRRCTGQTATDVRARSTPGHSVASTHVQP
jgi:LacI family transcriptional regulator